MMKSGKDSEDEKAIRIFIATHAPVSVGGGVERFLGILSALLVEEGYSVEVVSSDIRDILCSKVRPYAAWRVGRDIGQRLQKGDLTICNNYFSWNLPEEASIVIYHGTEIGRALATKSVYSRLRNLAVGFVNSHLDRRVGRNRVVVAVSYSAKEEVERHYGIEVAHVVPNAIDTSTFIPAEDKSEHRSKLGLPTDKFLVLSIGANDPRKGSMILSDFIIPNLNTEQHFVMLGKGLKPRSGVTILGTVPFDSMKSVYMACDAFVMPSYYEGCSFSNLEALACGVPSIVSPTGLGRDLMTNEILGRYVVPCDNPQGYVDCLRRLQTSHTEWMKVSNESRRYAVEHHDLSRLRKQYLEIVDNVVRQSNTTTMHDVLD